MNAPPSPPGPPPWPLPLRIGFRFVFCYVALYLVDPTGNSLLDQLLTLLGWRAVMPGILGELWSSAVGWLGGRLFGVPVALASGASSDTAYHWMDNAICALVALIAACIWSSLDRRRLRHDRAHGILRAAIRLHLVLTLLVFACVKVIPVQFGDLGPADWLVPVGEQSPSGLLWRFMVASPGYTRFSGLAELTGVVLLLSPRTTLLGALVTTAAMINVVALNLCYQVGVLNISLHLFLMALVLIVPDLGRLVDVFLLHRVVPARSFPPLFRSAGWERGFIAVKYGAFVVFASTMLWQMHQARVAGGLAAAAEPLRGIWTVERQELSGEIVPPLLTHTNRWRHMIVADRRATIVSMSGDVIRLKMELDGFDHRLVLRTYQPTSAPMFGRGRTDTSVPPAGEFEYQQPRPGSLILKGSYGGRTFLASLRKLEESRFRLSRRGIRWVTEDVDQQ